MFQLHSVAQLKVEISFVILDCPVLLVSLDLVPDLLILSSLTNIFKFISSSYIIFLLPLSLLSLSTVSFFSSSPIVLLQVLVVSLFVLLVSFPIQHLLIFFYLRSFVVCQVCY